MVFSETMRVRESDSLLRRRTILSNRWLIQHFEYRHIAPKLLIYSHLHRPFRLTRSKSECYHCNVNTNGNPFSNEPTVSSNLLDVTVEIPRSVLGRVFGGSPKKSVTSDGMGGARKPTVPIGEVIAAHRRPPPPSSRSKSKQHSSKSTNSAASSRRISHFFSRIPSASPTCSSSVNVSDEITID